MSKSNQASKFTTVLAIIFFSHFIVATIILLLNNNFINSTNKGSEGQSIDFSYVKVAILDRINHITQDIKLITDVIHETSINSHSAKNHQVASLFKAMIETRAFYDQVRLLNSKGDEVLRFNRKQNDAIRVPDNKLQDKSSRYYFKDLKSAEPNKFYMSKLDWNFEANKVELPLKATIRIGIPINLSRSVDSQGVLLINYLAAGLVSNLNITKGEEYLIISQDGVTAFNPEAINLLNSDHLFNKKYPKLWTAMQERNKGLYSANKHNYQYEKISFENINDNSHSAIWLVKKKQIIPTEATTNDQVIVYFTALVISFAFATLATLIIATRRRSLNNLSGKNTVIA